jgi:hypothetical protein
MPIKTDQQDAGVGVSLPAISFREDILAMTTLIILAMSMERLNDD